MPRTHRPATPIPFFLAALLAAAPAAAVPPGEAGGWREDLRFVARELPAVHANLFHTLDRAVFEARLDSLAAAVPGLGRAEIAVALAEIIAAVGDGHTRLTLPVDPAAGFVTGHTSTPPPAIGGFVFHHLPVRLAVHEDGLFVRQVGAAHAWARGARVLRIGDLAVEDAVKAVEPIVHRDNAARVRHLLPDYLVIPEVVIDLRGNTSGDNSRNAPLIRGLIRCRRIEAPGRLFVLIGPATFSAAMMFAVDLERHMAPIFVGEPTGGRPNSYGDSRRTRLPFSGLTIRASTLYWQYSDPRDRREAIAPHIAAPYTSADALHGRDPGLEAILDLFRRPMSTAPEGGPFEGVLTWRHLRFPVTVDLSGAPGTGFAAPELGVEATMVSGVQRDGARLAFSIPGIDAAAAGTWRGNRFLGSLRLARRGTHLLMFEP